MNCPKCGGEYGDENFIHASSCPYRDADRISFLVIRKKLYMALLDLTLEDAKSRAWNDWCDHERGMQIDDLHKESARLHAAGQLTYIPPPGRKPGAKKTEGEQ